jgi:putative endonuclease
MSCYYVYILKGKDGSFYTGLTHDLKRRIGEHKNGLSVCTKNLRPIKLIFYCCFVSKAITAQFEQYLKSHSGRSFRDKHLVSEDASNTRQE